MGDGHISPMAGMQGMMGMSNMQHNGMNEGMNGMNNGMQVGYCHQHSYKHYHLFILNFSDEWHGEPKHDESFHAWDDEHEQRDEHGGTYGHARTCYATGL